MCTFSPQHAVGKITRFHSECAFFRIREMHFFTATSKKQNHTFPSECALFRRQIFRFHPPQTCSKTAFSDSKQAAGCKIQPFLRNVHFSPQHTVRKVTPFLRNVHFFASGNCTFSPQQARSKITPFLRNVRFFAAKFSDECALFRHNTQ